MSYSKEDLRLAFESKSETFETFFNELKASKIVINKEKAKSHDFDEEWNTFDDVEFENIIELVEGDITEWVNRENYDTVMSFVSDFSRGLDDEGQNYYEVLKINGTFYKAELICEAEWVGDWSVRKNLPGQSTVIELFEITDYVLKDGEIIINNMVNVYK